MSKKTYRTQVLRAVETIYRTPGRPTLVVRVNAEEDPDLPCYDYEASQAPSAAREAAGRLVRSWGIATTVGAYHTFDLTVRVWMWDEKSNNWLTKGDWLVDLSSGLHSRKARSTP